MCDSQDQIRQRQYDRLQDLSSLSHWLVRLWIASLLLPTAGVHAQNFTSTESDFCRLAEMAREQSALFWTGRPLPGNWFQPCPVNWQMRSGSGSGWTNFQIQGGEVFGWQMTLRGGRDAVIRDVIPHEVDHAVRASLCRRPLPRWLDEGCASLFESAESHAQLRQNLIATRERYLNVSAIDQMDYPASGTETASLYAEGFSLVEYLLSRGTPRQLLHIQRSNDPLSRSLVDVYRVELPVLLQDWQIWERKRLSEGPGCDCVHCPWHRRPMTKEIQPPTKNSKQKLTLWTASWCAPCQKFHQDFTNLPEFRKQLEDKFQITERDIDQSPQAAIQANITTVPTFETGGRPVTGYLGPEWLLQQLGVETKSNPPDLPQSIPEQLPALSSNLPSSSAAPPLSPRSSETPLGLPEKAPSPWSRVLDYVPTALTVLSSVGIIGGTAVTGGAGGVALMILLKLLKQRATRVGQSKVAVNVDSTEGGAVGSVRAPFPRQLDEAGELLGLRQSEGRVATLDTLRGMFLDDELDKLKNDPDTQVASLVRRIREAVDTRVDEVAPLTTKT